MAEARKEKDNAEEEAEAEAVEEDREVVEVKVKVEARGPKLSSNKMQLCSNSKQPVSSSQ